MEKYTNLPDEKLAAEEDKDKEALIRQQVEFHKNLANKRRENEDDKSRV
jgi:hypothetical protein